MKLYYFLGVLLRPFATIAFFVYGHVFHTPRTRVLVRNEKNEILLLKNWLSQNEWSLPGGGVERGEKLAHAATRELAEETGIEVDESDLQYLFSIKVFGHDEVVYALEVQSSDISTDIPNRFEIQEIAWFSSDTLPEIGPLARQVLVKMELLR